MKIYFIVRSLGSVALRKAESLNSKIHFNYFALDLNEVRTDYTGELIKNNSHVSHVCWCI